MAEDKLNKKQNVLNGALILVVATALVKIIGAIYKIPITGIMGTLGRGYFASAYNIYTPVYAISMAGLPVAVSTIVSRNAALGKYRDVRQVMKVTTPLFLGLGVIGTTVLIAFSKLYVDSVNAELAIFSVICIAPSILFCCVMSTCRGYYEGLGNMYPTGISQVIEAAGKLVFGLTFSYLVIKYGKDIIIERGTIFGYSYEETDGAILYALAAAAAIFGVTLGTVFGAIFVRLRHTIKKDGITKEMLVNSPKPASKKSTAKDIVAIAVPAAISSLVLNVTNFIDTWMIQNRLDSVVENHYGEIMDIYGKSINAAGIAADKIHTFLYGAYDTTLDFKNLVPTIMLTLGVSAIPVISAAMAKKEYKTVGDTVNTVFRTAMLIALPAGAGFLALANPILSLLYNGTENQYGIAIAAPVLALYGLMTPIMCFSAPLTNMLQAIGRADVPAKSLAVACIFKIGLNYLLIGIPSVNVKGAVFGTAVFYVICIACNFYVLRKETKVRLDIRKGFVKPFIASIVCGAAAFLSYSVLSHFLTFGSETSRLNGSSFSCLIAIGIAGISYAAVILLTKTLVKDDILMLPMGEKIAKILAKYKLLG